ncbi:hypothetical protein HELRODRAFT_169579 [Helobdella robusta]|uniref:Uncharacterized protein n=1 Tax=Helobdella robusta TaxID=6412 RepID=T1F246_HELRO|nr:hypothetical protein HELRODRAFT_169579 [Helobdella robusta]ESO07881.1 hypothetical protein HELRODRAFT_169579 [Helobdella robusta]
MTRIFGSKEIPKPLNEEGYSGGKWHPPFCSSVPMSAMILLAVNLFVLSGYNNIFKKDPLTNLQQNNKDVVIGDAIYFNRLNLEDEVNSKEWILKKLVSSSHNDAVVEKIERTRQSAANATSDDLKTTESFGNCSKDKIKWTQNVVMCLIALLHAEVALLMLLWVMRQFDSMLFNRHARLIEGNSNNKGSNDNNNNSNNSSNDDDEDLEENDDFSWTNSKYVTSDSCYTTSRSNKNVNNKPSCSSVGIAKENHYSKSSNGNTNFNHKREEHYVESQKKSKKKYENSYAARDTPNVLKSSAVQNLKSPKLDQVVKAKTPSKENHKKSKDESKVGKEVIDDKALPDSTRRHSKIDNLDKNLFNRSPDTPFVGKNQSVSTIISKSKSNSTAGKNKQQINKEEKLETPFYSKNCSRASNDFRQSRTENEKLFGVSGEETGFSERNLCNSGVKQRKKGSAKTSDNTAANIYDFNFKDYKGECEFENFTENTIAGNSEGETEENLDETDFNLTQNASPLSSSTATKEKGKNASESSSASVASATTSRTKTAQSEPTETTAAPTVVTSIAASTSSTLSVRARKPKKSDRKSKSSRRISARKKGDRSKRRPSGYKKYRPRASKSRRSRKYHKSPNERSSQESLGSKRRSKRRRAGETSRRNRPFKVSEKRLSDLERKFSGDPKDTKKPFATNEARMKELMEKFSDDEGRPFKIHEYRMDELKEKFDNIEGQKEKKQKASKSKQRHKASRRGKSAKQKTSPKKQQKKGEGKDKKK